MTIANAFPRYTDHRPLVPVWCITPNSMCSTHRFFDTSPISPSGRYCAITRLPYEDKPPRPGDAAAVIVVDLAAGTERVVYETRGWDTQLGAQVQWGVSDNALFFNDVDTGTWTPFGVRMDIATGEHARLDGTIYMVSPDGRYAASGCLRRIGRTQAGYGVIVPDGQVPRNSGAPDGDGITLTDTESGRTRLLVSIRAIVDALRDELPAREYGGGTYYTFHVKWSPDGLRLMLVLRWVSETGGEIRPMVVTMNADGSGIRMAVPHREWKAKGEGHHPNWCPDSEHIIINLTPERGSGLRFVRARYDGGEFTPFFDAIPGSGHPTLHPNGRSILTDVYTTEPLAYGDGTTPIRWCDLASGTERVLIRIRTQPDHDGPNKMLRVDPHPAWDSTFTHIAFNACPHGGRQVFIADLSAFVSTV